MTQVDAQMVGDQALLPRRDLERLVQLARHSDEIEVRWREDDVPTWGLMRLAEAGNALNWLADEADLYTTDDLKVNYQRGSQTSGQTKAPAQ